MKDIIAWMFAVVVALFLILGMTWMFQGNDFFLHKYFDPKIEDVRRDTFEHSKAYTDGFRQELTNMQFEYIKASDEHKQALASVILHQVAEYDESKLPANLQQFVSELRASQKFNH